MHNNYVRDSLSITSQFYYCGLPLRLDSYSRCQFNCLYCFANARGGNRGSRKLREANALSIGNRLEKIQMRAPTSAIDELLVHRQPIHFGGMSDPFLPFETEMDVTLQILKTLAEHNYPTIISTKSDLFSRDKYLDILKKGKFIIQASISSMDNSFLSQVDLGTPGPTAMIRALEILKREGVSTACRIQPLLPTREMDGFDVIEACALAGVKHVAVEHLKLPIEKSWGGTSKLSALLNINLPEYYASRSARLSGRELVLPAEYRLERILNMRTYAHQLGLSFGAADNDFLLFSDGTCCCSGADLFDGFQSFYKYNYAEAVRQGITHQAISISSLDNIWRPTKSISRYVNSHSRIKPDENGGAGMEQYVKRNWNGSTTGNSPLAIYGVVNTGEYDQNGYRLYTISSSLLRLLNN